MTDSSIESGLHDDHAGERRWSDEEIYDKYAAPVERMLSTKVSSSCDVDDLLQTTFERFFVKRSRGLEVDDPGAFLWGIARNVLHEHWRIKARLGSYEDVEEHSLRSLTAGISTLVDKGEGRALLVEAMRTLKLKYQTVLELYYWERHSYRQIARIMNVSEGTVGTLLHRGRKELTALMERELQPPDPSPDPGVRALPTPDLAPSFGGRRRHAHVSGHSQPLRHRRSSDGDSVDAQ